MMDHDGMLTIAGDPGFQASIYRCSSQKDESGTGEGFGLVHAFDLVEAVFQLS